MKRLNLISAGAIFASFTMAGAALAADAFPSKPLEVVIHAKYGGGTDTTARMMMIRARRILEQDMTVVSKRGGSGLTAQNYIMSKAADGHTLIALTQTHLYTIAQGKSDMKIDDLVGVARAMDDPTFIAVSTDSPYKTLGDLIEASKKAPLAWGVAQIGGTEHVGLALFAKEAGIKYKPVAFGSGMQMVQNLMSGSIAATLPNVSEAQAQVADGNLRPLAVLAAKRLKDYPDVPTAIELGINTKTSTTRGYAVRKGTPPEVIKKLSDALVDAMRHDTFANYLKSSGLNAEDSIAGSEEWTAQIREEYEKAVLALNELGIKKK